MKFKKSHNMNNIVFGQPSKYGDINGTLFNFLERYFKEKKRNKNQENAK
jgi:hypothetical protein